MEQLSEKAKQYRNALIAGYTFERIPGNLFQTSYRIFLESLGLSPFWALSVNVFYFLANALFESPAGEIADRIGQKKAYLFGMSLDAVSFFQYFFAKTWIGSGAAEIVASASNAFRSDTLGSWIRNNFTRKETQEIRSSAAGISRLLSLPTVFIGAIVTEALGPEWPWIMAAIVAALSLFTMRRIFHQLNGDADTNFKWQDLRKSLNLRKSLENIKDSWRNIALHKDLRKLVFIQVMFVFLLQPLNMEWPLFFRNAGLTQTQIGIFAVVFTLAIALGEWMAGKAKSLNLGIVVAGTAVSIFVTAISPNLWMKLVMFCIHEFWRGLYSPLFSIFYDDHITDESRSLYHSTKNSIVNLGGALGLLFWGANLEIFSIATVLMYASLVMMIVSIWKIKDKD